MQRKSRIAVAIVGGLGFTVTHAAIDSSGALGIDASGARAIDGSGALGIDASGARAIDGSGALGIDASGARAIDGSASAKY